MNRKCRYAEDNRKQSRPVECARVSHRREGLPDVQGARDEFRIVKGKPVGDRAKRRKKVSHRFSSCDTILHKVVGLGEQTSACCAREKKDFRQNGIQEVKGKGLFGDRIYE